MKRPALVAIDLGAQSCRVSLLRWAPESDLPAIVIVHRFPNAPWDQGAAGIRWNLDHICRELESGLRSCADRAPEGIASIGVTGWGVDYLRLDSHGQPLAAPFCYRDPRNGPAMDAVHTIVPAAELYSRTGVQIQTINTVYQLYADKLAGTPSALWVMLPESILHWLGAPRVAEYTNATHTALLDPETRSWSADLFAALGLDLSAAPPLVPTGTALGPVRADLRRLPAFAGTQVIAAACHDTASAIAGIPYPSGNWAYISSGTWSLVGTVLPSAVRTPNVFAANFTNLGAAGGGVLFHRGLPGMWLLRQCLNHWEGERTWTVRELIAAAQQLSVPRDVLDLDDPAFLAPGDMPSRINAQRIQRGLEPLPDGSSAAPQYANLIFHSLAASYQSLIGSLGDLTGRRIRRICVVGGGSRNEYLNALTQERTGLPVERCSAESSTAGNFAVQWARLDQEANLISVADIAERARSLARAGAD
ncbi:MAG: FGGY-family carbohydrate kinase [Acidobacteriaceae bacterium]